MMLVNLSREHIIALASLSDAWAYVVDNLPEDLVQKIYKRVRLESAEKRRETLEAIGAAWALASQPGGKYSHFNAQWNAVEAIIDAL